MDRDDAAGRIWFAWNRAVTDQSGGQYLSRLPDMRLRTADALRYQSALARLSVLGFDRRCLLCHRIGEEPVVLNALVAFGPGDFDHRHSGGRASPTSAIRRVENE